MTAKETPEFAGVVRSMVRAHGRRVANGDPEDLAALMGLHAVVDQALHDAVAGLRERHSWGEIARGLGVARQSAWERYSADEPRLSLDDASSSERSA